MRGKQPTTAFTLISLFNRDISFGMFQVLVTPVQLATSSDFQTHSALVICRQFLVLIYRDEMMAGASVPKAEVTLGINYYVVFLALRLFPVCYTGVHSVHVVS